MSKVYRGFEFPSDQAKDFKNGICCFSIKHAAFGSKSQDCLPADCCRSELAVKFNYTCWSSIHKQLILLLKSSPFPPWYRWKIIKRTRDDFNFPIVNFPFICSNIPAAPAYGVYISQLIHYFRACGSYQDFLDRWMLLTRNLLNQGFLLVKLKSSLWKFTWLTVSVTEYLCHKWPWICSTCHKHLSWSFPPSWLITGFVTRLTQRMPLVGPELLTIPEHLSSHPVSCYSIFSVICMFCRSLFVLLYFFFWPLLSVLRFTDSDYPFGIFKLFF